MLFYFAFLVLINLCVSSTIPGVQNDPAVKRLQEYLQIDTSDPENIDNSEKAVNFWRRQAAELNLSFTVHRPGGLPICVLTLIGSKPELPSIMLNSHSDVVPVDDELWKYPPFSAHIDEEGNLFGRGVQDCKSNGVQYLEAIRKLMEKNITLERTVHVTVMPDEETGGSKGMVPFAKTKEFQALNVGFALDEGMPSSSDVLYALYVDKRPWQMKFEIQGGGGHGSFLKTGSVIEQVQTLINTAQAYRDHQSQKMKSKAATDFGGYTSLNINMIKGGIAGNVIPSRMTVVIDVRLSVKEEVSEFQSVIDSWMSKLGKNTRLEYVRRMTSSTSTAVDDTNKYWVAMRDTLKSLNVTVLPVVSPGTTDMAEIRALGIPAIGFTTNRKTEIKAHDVDEYLPVETFLEGIDLYAALIQRLANLP
ncbi:aminoacylase-1A-like [Bicyclus anynana]|uniref:N-acyl-aliphatic-L-amino acid amidohydrolase n=1 Tax=Bicyclus anynana TaxID=110368 RepID=A0ABM3LK18_BICAN|nr:aminoacylase-1A-like [Bicyclus anynana]